jgi:hypothetical protein
MNCIGCEYGREVWYEPWSGFGQQPGEAASVRYSQTGVPVLTLIALAIAAYLVTR